MVGLTSLPFYFNNTMNIKLTSELVQRLTELSLHKILMWGDGYTNTKHIAYMKTLGVTVPTELDEFVLQQSISQIDEEDFTCFTAIVSSVTPKAIPLNQAFILNVSGYYLTPNTSVVIGGNQGVVTFIDDNHISVEFGGLDQAGNNPVYIDDNEVVSINVQSDSWTKITATTNLDLKDIPAANVIFGTDGVTINPEGLKKSWGNFVGFPGLSAQRDHEGTFAIVGRMPQNGRVMFGFTTEGHGHDRTMFNETLAGLYITSDTYIYGFYAYAGKPGGGRNKYPRFKLEVDGPITPGKSKYRIYGLEESHSYNEGHLIKEDIMPNGSPDEGSTIYPYISPYDGFTAKLEAYTYAL